MIVVQNMYFPALSEFKNRITPMSSDGISARGVLPECIPMRARKGVSG